MPVPEPSGRDTFNGPIKLESSGFHDKRLRISHIFFAEITWDKAAGL